MHPEDKSRAQIVSETRALRVSEFAIPPREAARMLLSCVLMHDDTAGMIVETEAYLGADDLAAHASRGRTKRTEVLFGPPGRAYVYFIYGMHECLNVVVERNGSPGCVLIRALQPLCGFETMRARRGWKGSSCGLTNGPGKLTQALAINRGHYGARLDRGPLTIRHWRHRPDFAVAITPRIGISQCRDWLLRYTWAGHSCLSH